MPAIRARPETYILDTSALVAFFEGEPGLTRVKDLLRSGRRGRCRVVVSLMTTYEALYVRALEAGEDEGQRRVRRLRALPVEELPLTPSLALLAAHLKARHAMSVADSWIAATAIEEQAVLVHKDPELEVLDGQCRLEPLPYKG